MTLQSMTGYASAQSSSVTGPTPSQTLRIGMEMELVAGRIGTTDEGQPLLTYQFAPVGVDGARA